MLEFFCFSKHNILFPFLITKLFDTMFSIDVVHFLMSELV